jgi:hypothetical protein
MQQADGFIRWCGFSLSQFAYWSPEVWRQKGPDVSEIVENKPGRCPGSTTMQTTTVSLNELGAFLKLMKMYRRCTC